MAASPVRREVGPGAASPGLGSIPLVEGPFDVAGFLTAHRELFRGTAAGHG